MNDAITLYQFPISHFCEKARWALDYKQLPHKKHNFLPGFHVKAVKKIAGSSSVPMITCGSAVIQGSTDIISFLDQKFPQQPLTPSDPKLVQQVLRWEALADEQIGPHVRRLCYDVLLDHPQTVIQRFAQGGAWYAKPFLKLIFPKIKAKMTTMLKINPRSVQQSKEQLEQAITQINDRLSDHEFLVGEQFSRADLAVAALLSPLCMPDQFEHSGADMPADFARLRQHYQSMVPFAADMYRRFR